MSSSHFDDQFLWCSFALPKVDVFHKCKSRLTEVGDIF